MSAIARTVRGKISWSWGAAAVGLLIVGIACATLWRLFRDIDIGRVLGALKAQSLSGLLLSSAFVAAGYAMLSCYDLFALRAIGRDKVPYRVAAFASFTSYTIGHNFGATVFTSGVIRYRIYSAWGLGVGDIARIGFITSLTYWLGCAFVLGCGILYVPGVGAAIDHLPESANRLIGCAGLAAIAAYILWLSPCRRVIGRANWQVVLPNPRATLLQIGIGATDLVFVSLAMYVLLPAQPAISPLELIVSFVTAMLIGVMSYAPGGLGVIEAAMFIALPQFRTEELLASLLTFRLMYFVIPLLFAALLLGAREFRLVVAAALRRMM